MRASTVAHRTPPSQEPRALSPAVRRYAAHAQRVSVTGDLVTADGFRLGRWVERQRIARATRTLPSQRERELDAVGFDWRVEPIPRVDAKRLRMLTELAAYREVHGTAEVPVHYTTDDGERLGEWLYRQIKRWRTGTLADDERAVLELFGVTPNARRRGPRPGVTAVPEHHSDEGR
ncbi:helicase associated domain-containing protein [Rhodococcus artemisiae]|uniref:Helicase associated domain-containing protein n=1 Tax=Rhodococcus artemisiae TaxID=714159 RepID=A0ABU7L3H9_9NOCA|nr:helicase associated domain-containing protein [Rhodococcus artemisiae]MEE2056043.1 helicase associated domain-containing protein [Rhodococcus artemisiae]